MSYELNRRDVLKVAASLPLLGAASERYYTHVLDRIPLEEAIGMQRDLYNQFGVRDDLCGRLRIRRVRPYCEAREGPRKGNISMTVIYDSMLTWEEAIKLSGVNPDNVEVRLEAKG